MLKKKPTTCKTILEPIYYIKHIKTTPDDLNDHLKHKTILLLFFRGIIKNLEHIDKNEKMAENRKKNENKISKNVIEQLLHEPIVYSPKALSFGV